MLADVPAVPEGIVELTMQVAPEGLLQGLTHRRARRHRLGEHRLCIGNVQSQHYRRATDRRRCEDTHLRELVRQMQLPVADAQLHRHEPRVRRGDPAQLLGAEGLAIEGNGPLGVANNDVRCDCHCVWMVRRPRASGVPHDLADLDAVDGDRITGRRIRPDLFRRCPRRLLGFENDYPSARAVVKADPVPGDEAWRLLETGDAVLVQELPTSVEVVNRRLRDYCVGCVLLVCLRRPGDSSAARTPSVNSSRRSAARDTRARDRDTT